MSRGAEKKQNFMHGAAILTVGVVIMKVLGAIYKVPLGNILGDYGYGIFLSTYNVYNIFFTLSTAAACSSGPVPNTCRPAGVRPSGP